MSKNKTTQVSDFGEAALALDREFLQMERLGRELERLSIPSDKGMERAQTLLGEVEGCRSRMAVSMQSMVEALENARARNAIAEKHISDRATKVQERQAEAEKMVERFRALAEMVKKVTSANMQFQHLKGTNVSAEDRAALTNHLPGIHEQLGILVEEANKLLKDAREAHLKTLERNTDSLRQSLQALRHRLGLLMEG